MTTAGPNTTPRSAYGATLLGGLVMVAFFGIVWLLSHPLAHAAPKGGPAPPASPHERSPDVAANVPAPRRSTASTPCREQTLDIVNSESRIQQCVGATRIEQNGGIRAYIVLTDDGERSLRIETAQSTVRSVALMDAEHGDFRCDLDACANVQISERDATGRRNLLLRAASLARVQADGTAARDDSVRVSGTLNALADDESYGLACGTSGVSITTDNGAHGSFCAKDGLGYELQDDGGRRYRFTSLEGESIAIVVDTGEHIRSIEYAAGVVRTCVVPACGVVSLSAPNAAGERQFSFIGATLMDAGGGASTAMLNGTLTLPQI